jgi:formylglycine-generating enzyme required for sulfatase activity
MTSRAEPRGPRGQAWRALAAGVLGAGILVGGAMWAGRQEPPRCGEGAVTLGPRCCGEGQTLDAGACRARPRRCPARLRPTDGGCVAEPRKIALPGGRVRYLSVDWEAEGHPAVEAALVAPFSIDAIEVTWDRFGSCVAAGKCLPLRASGEPGQPVTGVTAFEAARFCAFAGGALPSSAQWLFAAAGAEGRRFPWGPNGAVCLRAAWGLASGPCAQGATVPDVTGAHQEGETPEGVLDMAGNVAEWTAPRPDGLSEVRGGSFRDREATALKTWSSRWVQADTRLDDVGFRCAYPARAE